MRSVCLPKAKELLKERETEASVIANTRLVKEYKNRDKSSTENTLFSFEGTTSNHLSGDDSKEDPPVPMPNTEVKLLNVDDTWRVTAWESRKLPEFMARWSSG